MAKTPEDWAIEACHALGEGGEGDGDEPSWHSAEIAAVLAPLFSAAE